MKKAVAERLGALFVGLVLLVSPGRDLEARADELLPARKLGIQNGRFGSRMDLDFHFDPSMNECWTGTLGSMMDARTSFVVATRLKDGTVRRFSPGDAYLKPFWYQVLKLLPDRLIQYGAHTRRFAIPGIPNGITLYASLATISPFVPTRGLDAPALAASILPAFYEEITVANPGSSVASGSVLVSLDHAVDFRERGQVKTIYFRNPDGSDREGVRALAVVDAGGSVSWGIGDALYLQFQLAGRLANRVGAGENRYGRGGFAIPFTLQPGESMTKTLVYAGYNGGDVMTDQRTASGLKFYYTRLFGDVDQVADYAFGHQDEIVAKSGSFSSSLLSGDPEADFLAAQAVHSYLAETVLLHDPRTGKPRFYVLEGNYGYLSTLDVAYDHGVFEADFHPWALKLQLEEWGEYGARDSYGLYLQHDMGQYTTVMPAQAYPANMGVEENVNYVLLAFLYWKKAGDGAFLRDRLPLVEELLDSLRNRDTDGNGIVDAAAYLTTFDFDAGVSAIGQARESTYIAVKEFASFLAAEEMFRAAGRNSQADRCRREASKIHDTLIDAYRRFGYLPASLASDVGGWADRTIVNFEGLAFLLLTGTGGSLLDDLIASVGTDLHAAVRACEAPQGYRLTSSSPFTWGSKTFNTKMILDAFGARGLGTIEEGILDKAKAVEVRSELGFSDSWNAESGALITGFLYPRGVSVMALRAAQASRPAQPSETVDALRELSSVILGSMARRRAAPPGLGHPWAVEIDDRPVRFLDP